MKSYRIGILNTSNQTQSLREAALSPPSKQINIISLPRSGQHLLQSILQYIFINHKLEYSFCEYYKCCKSIPCKFNKIICKHHDRDLDYKILPSEKYVVLYRDDMILQIEAYYRYNIKLKNIQKYELNTLIEFIKGKTKYYYDFKDKWVHKSYDNVLKIEYYDLVTNTVECINKIISHIRPDIIVNSEIINMIPELKFSEYGKLDTAENKIGILNKMPDELYQKIKMELIDGGIKI